jgi:hypothetical protein
LLERAGEIIFMILELLFAALAFASESGAGPTPTAAGQSPMSKAPAPIQEEPLTHLDEDDLLNSAEEGDLPEPFFCNSVLQKNEGKDEWIYLSSDYPREIPPFGNQVLSPAFIRQQKPKSSFWGNCVEAKTSKSESQIELTLYAYFAKAKAIPEIKTCSWKPKGKVLKSAVSLKVGQWSGIEFAPSAGERIRFTAHWPSHTQEESTGEFCRQFALAMNNKSFDLTSLKKLK